MDFFAIAEEVGFENQWLLFDTYLDSVAQSCADATEANWVDRLGGTDVFTSSCCEVDRPVDRKRLDYHETVTIVRETGQSGPVCFIITLE